ncbi:MAG: 3'-5' exonuclease [Deltaproteobacteria bacterium]|jgi:DNA polymerase III epsilon subunit family exonuclease|nr:3'-5' exonuclease [Deltaproteobacteria bacterium]
MPYRRIKTKNKIPALVKDHTPQKEILAQDLCFTIVDTETCGKWLGSRIVEIAYAKTCQGKIIESNSFLVNPHIEIPQETIEIHGITNKMVKNSPSIKEILPELVKNWENTVLIAHNHKFDEAIISTEAARHNLKISPLPILDNIALAKYALEEQESYSLYNLSHSLNLKTKNFHRAGSDVETTNKLFNFFLEQLAIIKETNFGYLAEIGNLRYLTQSSTPLQNIPPRFAFLKLGVVTKSDVEIIYIKNNRELTYPATLKHGFCLNRKNYIEIRDHRDNKIKTLRLDRIKDFLTL